MEKVKSSLHKSDTARTRNVSVCDLGQMDYETAWKLQTSLQQDRIRAKRANPPESPDHLILLVEHPPVYTLGKSGDKSNLLVSDAELSRLGASYYHIDRGGDITYHGPGQLVAYPILDLDYFFTDIGKYLRLLEESVIRTCKDYNLETGRIPGKTGVWILPESGTPRKICAMGIRCSRWVTMHGLAFNINTELDYFTKIVPCGITDGAVTSLAREVGSTLKMDEVAKRWVGYFAELFDASIQWIQANEIRHFLTSSDVTPPNG